MIVFGSKKNITSTVGVDVSVYVSGSKNLSAGKTVFVGDAVFSGSLIAQALSGSLTRLNDGSSYLVAGTNVTVVSSSNGQVTISATGGSDSAWTVGVNRIYSTGSVSIDASGRYADQIGSDVFFFVSGTVNAPASSKSIAVFGGDSYFSGTSVFSVGLSGSVQQLPGGLSYLVAGDNVSISSGTNGQVVISSTSASTPYYEMKYVNALVTENYTTNEYVTSSLLTITLTTGAMSLASTDYVIEVNSNVRTYTVDGGGLFSAAKTIGEGAPEMIPGSERDVFSSGSFTELNVPINVIFQANSDDCPISVAIQGKLSSETGTLSIRSSSNLIVKATPGTATVSGVGSPS